MLACAAYEADRSVALAQRLDLVSQFEILARVNSISLSCFHSIAQDCCQLPPRSKVGNCVDTLHTAMRYHPSDCRT